MHTLTIPPVSVESEQATRNRLHSLAKVPGSLGVLEDLAIRLAGMTAQERPLFPKKSVVLFAADHDIALHGLSATGQEVTALQVRNFLQGGGTINAFARNAGADLVVVDVGVKTDFDPAESPALARLVNRKIVHAARDFSKGPALSREEARACLQVGIDMARSEAAKGVSLLAAGEMGIGNTSPSSAIAAVMTGASVEFVTGVGSGIAPEAVARKIAFLKQGIALNNPDPHDAVDVLAKIGGPELGAMAGLMLGGASLRIPVLVDGFIAGAAAAIAIGIRPEVQAYLVGSHVSAEPGHQMLMRHLGIQTYFDFGLRLGEGTGAALFFPIIDASVRILHEMETLTGIGL